MKFRRFKKFNILHIGNTLSAGGGQLAIQNFSRYLNKDFFNVFICGIEEGGVRGEELVDDGFEVLNARGDTKSINKFIKDNNVHLIHFHRRGSFEKKHADIIEQNKDKILIETNVFGELDRKYGKFFDLHLVKSIFSLNKRYLPKVGKKDFFENYRVLYNPVDVKKLDSIRPSQRQINKKKDELGIGKDGFVVGKIGARPAIEKWGDLMLDFIPFAGKYIPNLKVLIQGVPKSRIKKAEDLGVAVLPNVSDYIELATLYNCVDVFVHLTKRGENSGNSINEAMAYGKPIIVNSTPRKDNGQLEQVIHGENGLIASYPQSVANALKYMYENKNEMERLRLNGRKKVEKEYEVSKITRVLEKMYLEKLEKKGYSLTKRMKEYIDEIDIYPTEEEIIKYREEYKNRLKWEFGGLTLIDRIYNLLTLPSKSFIKLRDFMIRK